MLRQLSQNWGQRKSYFCLSLILLETLHLLRPVDSRSYILIDFYIVLSQTRYLFGRELTYALPFAALSGQGANALKIRVVVRDVIPAASAASVVCCCDRIMGVI